MRRRGPPAGGGDGRNVAAARGRAAPNAAETVPSMLFQILLFFWSWGFISLPFVQKIAMAAHQDLEVAAGTNPFPDLRYMAHLGLSGKYPNHMQREMDRYLAEFIPCQMAPPFRCRLHIKISKTAVALREQAINLPHVMFSKIYHNRPIVWLSKIAPSEEVIESFWTAMDNASHPMITFLHERPGGYKKKGIPLRMHGDDVPVVGVGKSWTKMASVFSWTDHRSVFEEEEEHFVSMGWRFLV